MRILLALGVALAAGAGWFEHRYNRVEIVGTKKASTATYIPPYAPARQAGTARPGPNHGKQYLSAIPNR